MRMYYAYLMDNAVLHNKYTKNLRNQREFCM